MSERQEERKEERPDPKPFLGLIEHISRSADIAFSATGGLPTQILSEIGIRDGIHVEKKTDIAFELGRIHQTLWLLHKFLIDDLAENFYSKPKNVKRFLVIMSYLAKAFWDFKDGKADSFATLEGAIEEAINDLEDYLIDVINAIINGDDYSDDDSGDDGSQA